MFFPSIEEKGVQSSLKQFSFWQIFILLLSHIYSSKLNTHKPGWGPHITKDLLTLENMLDRTT